MGAVAEPHALDMSGFLSVFALHASTVRFEQAMPAILNENLLYKLNLLRPRLAALEFGSPPVIDRRSLAAALQLTAYAAPTQAVLSEAETRAILRMAPRQFGPVTPPGYKQAANAHDAQALVSELQNLLEAGGCRDMT